MSECVCVCICACIPVSVCLCVCVCERERGREGGEETNIQAERVSTACCCGEIVSDSHINRDLCQSSVFSLCEKETG